VSFLADMAAALVAFDGVTYWQERSARQQPRKFPASPPTKYRKETT
jgi:hypothetical protein